MQCFLRLCPWLSPEEIILLSNRAILIQFSISQSKFNINEAIPLWHNILIQTNSSQKNKMQKLPILHLVRDINPWHLELICRELSKPAPICIQSPLSPVTAFQLVTLDPSYLHGRHFRIWGFLAVHSPAVSPSSLNTHYSIFYLNILLQSTPL